MPRGPIRYLFVLNQPKVVWLSLLSFYKIIRRLSRPRIQTKLVIPQFLDALDAVGRLFFIFEDKKETNQGVGVEVTKGRSIRKATLFTILCKM